MSTKKFGIVAGIALALSVVISPAFAACSLQDLGSCDNNGLMALIAQMLSGSTTTTTTTTTTGTISGIPAGFQFTTNLANGSTGEDVKYLQILLNSDATTAVGNAGNETSYFGSMTKAAVIKFQNKYASETLAPYGLTAGTGFFGSTSRAKANAILSSSFTGYTFPAGCTSYEGFSTTTGQSCSGTGVTLPAGCTSTSGYSPTTGQPCSSGTGTVITGSFTVSLASDNPATGTFVQGQATADLAHYTFSNGTATPVKVTSLSLDRIGVSADVTLANVYLFYGATRITDAASVSSGKIIFNASNGIFTIPANTTMTIAVKSDIAAISSGQTIGVSLSAISSDGTLSSALPIAGNISSIATATLAGVTVETVSPSANTTVNAGVTNYTMFSAPLTISTRPVNLNGITLKLIGSAPTDALTNLKLYVNGINYGNAITLNTDGTAVFSLATPVAIQSGSATVEVRGDVVKGSSRNFSFSLQNAADLVVSDSTYNVNITATGIPATTAIVSINSGVVSVTLDPAFNTTSVTGGSSNVTLAKFYFKAFGEDVKVSSLDVTPSINLDNVVVYVNGVPTVSNQNYTGTKLHFNLGSSLIIPANTPVSVEVRGDTKAAGVNITTGTVAIALNVYANNAQGVSSSTLTTAPATEISGPTLTIGAGGLVLAQASGVVDGTVVPNTANQKLGSFVIQAGSSESVRINNISVAMGGTLNVASLSNLYIKYGSAQSTPINPQATNNFSVDVTLQPSTSLTVEVYGDVGSMGTVANANSPAQTFVNTDATAATASVAASSASVFGGTADSETASITVNGHLVTATTGVTAILSADAIVNALNSDSTIAAGWIASNSGTATVTLTRKIAGSAGNFTVVTSVTGANTFTTAISPTVNGTNGNTQVDTSLPANVEIGDVFTVLINSTPFSWTAIAATNKDVVEGLAAAINASSAVNAIVTATEDDTTLTVTADVAGTAGAFTMTSDSVNGTHSAVGSNVIATLGMSATGTTSNSVVVSSPATLAGQTMTVSVGSLTAVALASYSPVAQFVIGGTTGSTVGTYNLKATNGDVTIDELTFTTSNNAVGSITVNGASAIVVSNAATITGVNYIIPAGYAGKDMPVNVNYNPVGLGGLTSNISSTVTLTSIKYHVGSATTTVTASIGLPAAARVMTLVASKPTVEFVALTTAEATLGNGSTILAKVRVSADTTGNVILNDIPLDVTTNGAVTITGDALTVEKNGSTFTAFSETLGVIGASSNGTGLLTLTSGYTIAAGTSETFTIYATTALSDGTGDSVRTKIMPLANFDWKDVNGNVDNIDAVNILNYPTSSVIVSN
jgi:hypothetical protein